MLERIHIVWLWWNDVLSVGVVIIFTINLVILQFIPKMSTNFTLILYRYFGNCSKKSSEYKIELYGSLMYSNYFFYKSLIVSITNVYVVYLASHLID